ncbi:MAG: hypothetical protein ACI865_000675 [Flavobacteriaceae bacterium]|jgi:hypothetical protein
MQSFLFNEMVSGERLNSKRNYIIQPLYEEIGGAIRHNLLRVKKNGKWGYIDRTGKVKIPFRYDEACSFESAKATVKIGDNACLIDTEGEKIKDIKKMYECYDQDLLSVMMRPTFDKPPNGFEEFVVADKIGIRKRDGTVILPAEFDEIGEYSNGAITVRKEELWGAFSLDGKPLLKIQDESLGRVKKFDADNEYFR